ncbi:MAG: N-acetyltransferase [Flavobacteriaceae bacterium]|nr:N-acetyltransferase [Flavobacteriaceae bacterium]
MAEFKSVLNDNRRIDMFLDDQKVGYLDFHENMETFFLDYVFVDPEFRGREVGVEIVKAGLRLAQEKNLNPRPVCGYAAVIMRRNNWPENFSK